MWMDLSRLGESGFLLPLGLLLTFRLLYNHGARMAGTWLFAFGGAVGLVLASKVAFFGWGIGVRAWNFTCFSGHTTLAASVYPVFAWVLVAHRTAQVRIAAVLLAMAFAAAIAASRIVLHAHSLSEVLCGEALGSAAALVTLWQAQPARRRSTPWILVGLSALLMADLGYGYRPPSHHLVVEISLWVSGHDKPYRRDQWLNHRAPDGTLMPTGILDG